MPRIRENKSNTIISNPSDWKTPDILCDIDKIEVIWGLYIDKWGEIGRLLFFIYYTLPTFINDSAIWTEFNAAPFNKLSETTQKLNPFSFIRSFLSLET